MKIFKVDFNRLVALLLPTFLRQYRILLLIRSIVFPIRTLYDNFLKNRNLNIDNINHNGQVCYLRKVLNNNFDTSERRITIEDIVIRDWVIIYKEVEDKPKFLYKEIENEFLKIWRESMIGTETMDFIVNVPFGLSSDDLIRMKSIIDYYKLASKRYLIQSL